MSSRLVRYCANSSSLIWRSVMSSYTPKTPTTLKDLKTLIEQDRERGYGVSMGGYETGISTIAAPVFNDRHQVTAAVSITVPAQQLNEEQTATLIPQVQQAAAQLTQRISHMPPRRA